MTSNITESVPKISVIMNCLNGERYVAAAIESIYAQTYGNWEIIFLDNASTDNTASIAANFDARLRYFRNPECVPLGRARNLALQKASGDYIAFLDSDDIWLPHKLEKQMDLFQNRPELGLVFGDTELHYQDTGVRTTYFKSHGYKPPRGRIFRSLLNHYSIPMLTAVIRTAVLATMDHWFDESYQVCDDFDFFMRLAYGWECDYVDEPLASCLIHANATTYTMHRYAAGEMAKTIEKFRVRYSDFDQRFGKDVQKFIRQVAYKQGKSHWREGRNLEARNEFSKYVSDPKFLLSYLAALLPYEVIEYLRRSLERNRR